MPCHLLTNFEIRKYYQSEPTFNGVYSRNNLSKIILVSINNKNSLYSYNNKRASYDAICFESFWVEHIPKKKNV